MTGRERRDVVAYRWALLVLVATAGVCTAGVREAIRQDALKRAFRCTNNIEGRFVRAWARYAVAEEWAHTDPKQAADIADRLESWTAKRDLLSVILFDWGRRDPKAAAAWGLRFQERTKGTLFVRNTALHYAVAGMVTRDAKLADELMWKHLREDDWGGHPRRAPMAAARELARSDPAAALAMAEKIKHEGCRVDALRGVLRAWAGKDPQAARTAMSGRKEKDFQKAFPRDLAEGWAHKDPRAAAELAKTISQKPARRMALSHVALELVKTDPKAAAALCAVLVPLNAGDWHEQMPRAALAVRTVAEAFARKDPRAAARWAASLPEVEADVDSRRRAFDGVAAGWAASDPRAALAFYHSEVEEGSPNPNRGTGDAYPAIARGLAKTDVPAALALVKKTKRLVLKSHILHDVAVEVARRDPAAAAEVVEKWAGVVDYYTYRTGAASAVAGAWAAKSPKAAAAWAAKLKPVRDRLAALRAVAAAWAKASPPAAHAWADTIGEPQEAAHAFVGVAEGAR